MTGYTSHKHLSKGDVAMAWHGKVRPGLLLLLFSFVVISEATAKTIEQYRYDTAYACEGKTLKIECKDGEIIKLIRANYGRFSITICNDHGNTDWSVNCMSPKSLRVLHERCTHYQNCSIPASTSMFGDPCPGTHKYLEAHYQCLPATTTTTTSRPSPPWLITSQPPMWSTVKPPSTRSPSTKVTNPPPPPAPAPVPSSTLSSTSTAKIFPQSTIKAKDSKNDEKKTVDVILPPTRVDMPLPEDITTLPFTTVTPNDNVRKWSTSESTQSYTPYIPSDPNSWANNFDNVPYYCNATTIRNINWPRVKVNSSAIEPCPGGTTGFAKWNCSEVPDSDYPQWYPKNPDLSECRSVWLTSLEQRIKAGRDQLISIISDLAQVTSSKTLYGGDMAITTNIIKQMTDKMSQDIQTFPDTRQREAIVTEMLMDVAKTSSNLLDSSQHPSWRDLSYKEQMNVATSLLIGLEENAFLLADTVMSKKTVDREFKNILLSVRVLDTKLLTNEIFPSENTNSQWKASNDSIELPKGALLENSDGNLVRLVFVAFDRLEEILQWQPDTSDISNNVSKTLNSKVISASLGKGRHIQLKEPVKLTLKHIKTENVSNPTCVFWDYTTNAWSEEGCHVDISESNYTHTVCYCDHLTNFAILMDVHAIYLPIPHEIALQVITYIGCIISIICLILAIVTFQLFRGLKSDRTTIHCNLCTCLLIAECLFLIGIDQTENRIFCGVIAGFLMYFFLCAFVWMFFEGFQLYVMLIEVFEVEKSRIRWYYIFAYGLPFIIVFISATVYPQGFGTARYCWLQANNYFIYSFVGPVILVLVLNVIFLTMAIVMMCKHASASVSMKNKEHSRLASTSGKEENALQIKFQAHLAWLKGAFVLVFLLGLTWTFGLLYINQESVYMAYSFAVLNSLQGFFIFLFHCVQNEKVRKEYHKFIRKHSWLPKCLHCSKGSAAGGSSSGSGSGATTGLAKDRRPSLYTGSNGNPSGGTDNTVLTPHGTSLQFSQSCTNVNRVCRTPVPTSTSANMAATLCRPIRTTTPTTPITPSPDLEHPNTSTLPYIRNFYKNSAANPNMPKSVSTWGPLHKPLHCKNISFKSYSRDSGHGGSEQEESPRSHIVLGDPHRHASTLAKDVRQHQGHSAMFLDYNMRQSLQMQRKKNGVIKPPWNHHTYTEIYDGQGPTNVEDDPVYEEIDRNEIQVSDLSDEDGKRQSDMSRQSSRSYGDHRPLIPYSPGNDRTFLEVITAKDMDNAYRMRCNNLGIPTYRTGGDAGTVRSLAAVLDGETVVCHLEPPVYPHMDVTYVSRTLNLPPYSES